MLFNATSPVPKYFINTFMVSVIVLKLAASFLWLCYVHNYICGHWIIFSQIHRWNYWLELWSQPILFWWYSWMQTRWVQLFFHCKIYWQSNNVFPQFCEVYALLECFCNHVMIIRHLLCNTFIMTKWCSHCYVERTHARLRCIWEETSEPSWGLHGW